jgi:hypothetical protein
VKIVEDEQNLFEAFRSKLVAARIAFFGQLAKFSREELALSPGKGEWSPLQVAYHLYVTDGETLEQMQRVQSEENPLLSFPEIEGPAQVGANTELPATLEAIMAGMAARREELFQFLATLPHADWERTYRHPRQGQLNFPQLVQFLVDHDQRHAQHLARIKLAREQYPHEI